MEKLMELINYVRRLPLPARVLSTIIILLLSIILIFFSGCAFELTADKMYFDNLKLEHDFGK